MPTDQMTVVAAVSRSGTVENKGSGSGGQLRRQDCRRVAGLATLEQQGFHEAEVSGVTEKSGANRKYFEQTVG